LAEGDRLALPKLLHAASDSKNRNEFHRSAGTLEETIGRPAIPAADSNNINEIETKRSRPTVTDKPHSNGPDNPHSDTAQKHHFHGVEKIVSGGQTGVDQAALDAAIALGIPHGGWCPMGRMSEAGPIDPKYQLTELPGGDYAARTEQNVIDSSGTLILYHGRLQGGTALTYRCAKKHGKPVHRIRLDRQWSAREAAEWISRNQIVVLNIAGPRASSSPELYQQSYQAIMRLFEANTVLFP
jgi:hypothetical protein